METNKIDNKIDSEIDKEDEVTIFKYRLFDKYNRQHCDLKQFKTLIEDVYKLHEPDVKVEVYSDFYIVISQEPKIKAVTIGKELSSRKKLAKYGGYTKSGRYRLFARCGNLSMKKSKLENICHNFEGGKPNEEHND